MIHFKPKSLAKGAREGGRVGGEGGMVRRESSVQIDDALQPQLTSPAKGARNGGRKAVRKPGGNGGREGESEGGREGGREGGKEGRTALSRASHQVGRCRQGGAILCLRSSNQSEYEGAEGGREGGRKGGEVDK